jgi:hypothetical protein
VIAGGVLAGGEGATRSIVAAQAGSHQFHRPNRDTSAGTSSARTTVASRSIPAPTPVAKIFRKVNGALASATMARNKMRAASLQPREQGVATGYGRIGGWRPALWCDMMRVRSG